MVGAGRARPSTSHNVRREPSYAGEEGGINLHQIRIRVKMQDTLILCLIPSEKLGIALGPGR